MALLLAKGILRLGELLLHVFFGRSERKGIEDVLKVRNCLLKG